MTPEEIAEFRCLVTTFADEVEHAANRMTLSPLGTIERHDLWLLGTTRNERDEARRALYNLQSTLTPTPETVEKVRERLQGIVDSCQDADWPDWKSFRLSVMEDARKALAALQPGAREEG